MTLLLPNLYHWSPRSARDSILKRGLRPTCPSGLDDAEGNVVPMVCLSPSPSMAWALSGAIKAPNYEASEWDLWQVSIADSDAVHLRPNYGNAITEIRIANRIPKRRVWHVATRTVRPRGRRQIH